MSAILFGAVFERGPEDAGLLLTLLAIAENADDFGLAWPSIRTLALRGRTVKRNAIRRVQQLVDEGWISVDYRVIDGKGSAYVINLEKLGQKTGPKSRRSPFWPELLRVRRERAAASGMLHFPKEESSGENLLPQTPTLWPETSAFSGDNLSPDSAESEVTFGAFSGDKLAPGEVTFGAFSGDISSVPSIKNPKEPSIEPEREPETESASLPVTGDQPNLPFEDCRHGEPGFELSVGIAARWVMKRIVPLGSAPLEEALIAALRHRSKEQIRETLQESAQKAVESIAAFRRDAELMNRPWGILKFFAEGHWERPNTWPYLPRAKAQRDAIETARRPAEPEPDAGEPAEEVPAGVDVEAGLNAWDRVRRALHAELNPKSFETWIKPLRAIGCLDGVLYVGIPSSQFEHVGEKWARIIQANLPAGIHEVKLLRRGRS